MVAEAPGVPGSARRMQNKALLPSLAGSGIVVSPLSGRQVFLLHCLQQF